MKNFTLIKFLFILLILFACAPVVKNPAPLHDHAFQVSPYMEQEYRIQIGDGLDIKFFYNPELNELVTVRPDGRISLQLVHEIKVAGLTPSELTDSLTQKYAPELKKPEITVIVRSFGAHKIYVDGEVNKSGMFPLMGLMTVMQAISQAGGVKDTARTKEVVIIRHGADNRRLALQVNVQKVLDGTDMSQDIALKPFDIVYVPRSSIANVDIWVDQYVRKILPVNITTGFGYYP
ncbi:MAG: polysaccharide biosynthesis/export family protein [Thermodesulfobacteriota bacterium]|jgi:protein involved in polysaccharide export with SLBB domain